MDKSQLRSLKKKSSGGSQENKRITIARSKSLERAMKKIDEDLLVCQMQTVSKANFRETFNKSMSLLITAREKILVYSNHTEYARRKLKEAREAIYLMDVEDINLAAEFEEKIQATIERLAKLEDSPLRSEHKTELSHRISDTEKILQILQGQNEVAHEALNKKIAEIMELRQKMTAKRNQPLKPRNATNNENEG